MFLNFIIYSFIGFCLETVYVFLKDRRLENRKLMVLLPLCPMYGIGAICMLLGLSPFANNVALVFLGGMAIGTIVEYAYSAVFERCFNVRSWDYSKCKVNIAGRVCILYSVFWGALALVLMFVVKDYIKVVVELTQNWVIVIILGVFALDAVFTGRMYYLFGKKHGKPLGCPTLRRADVTPERAAIFRRYYVR